MLPGVMEKPAESKPRRPGAQPWRRPAGPERISRGAALEVRILEPSGRSLSSGGAGFRSHTRTVSSETSSRQKGFLRRRAEARRAAPPSVPGALPTPRSWSAGSGLGQPHTEFRHHLRWKSK